MGAGNRPPFYAADNYKARTMTIQHDPTKTLLMVSPRDFMLNSTLGHSLSFKKDQPTAVPHAIVDEALKVNILPFEGGTGKEFDDPNASASANTSISGALRRAVLFHAISEIVKRNDPDDFSGGGRPNAKAVSDRAGVRISATELNKYWDEYRDLVSQNADLPTHPNLTLVVDIMGVSSKPALFEYADLLGVSKDSLAGLTLSACRDRLVAAAARYDSKAPVQVGKTKLEKDD